jgi:hypothetical protein
MRVPDHRVLATNKVYWVGHPLAVVIAENRYIGRDAVDVIQVEYDELPPVLDEEKAADSKSPLIHDKIGSNVAYKMSAGEGDIEGALKSADKIVQQKILHKRLCADRPGTPWRAGSLLSRRTADGLRRGLFRHVNRSVTAPSSSRRLAPPKRFCSMRQRRQRPGQGANAHAKTGRGLSDFVDVRE